MTDYLISRQVEIIPPMGDYVLATPMSDSGSRPYTDLHLERVVAFEISCEERSTVDNTRYCVRKVTPIGVSGNSIKSGVVLLLYHWDTRLFEVPQTGHVFGSLELLLEEFNKENSSIISL